MAYSGGKDSTYTLDIFINRYKLRVLALTLDNTFISEKSFQNMRKVCENLGVDHQIIRPNPKMLGRIFKTAAKKELFSSKTLERASTICTCCIGFVKSSILRTAIEKDIPFSGFGWSPGQAPVQASVMKTNASLMQATQKAIYDPLHKIAGDEVNPYFLFDEHFHQKERFPWNVHPLAFLNYDEENIIARIKELGWEKPDDTDANSTNCLLNAFANQVHKDRYDFHPYVWELANMVRNGSMERSYAINKIETPENEIFVNYARKKLDL
jgi:tRNA(Ile)-lysidine synthase TilS/MesJ